MSAASAVDQASATKPSLAGADNNSKVVETPAQEVAPIENIETRPYTDYEMKPYRADR
jgi:hypothetical protein